MVDIHEGDFLFTIDVTGIIVFPTQHYIIGDCSVYGVTSNIRLRHQQILHYVRSCKAQCICGALEIVNSLYNGHPS